MHVLQMQHLAECTYNSYACTFLLYCNMWLDFGNKDVTFDIIYISVYLRPSRLYYWFNKWLKQSQMTSITIKTLEVCSCCEVKMLKHENSIYFMRNILACFLNNTYMILCLLGFI